MSIRLCTIITLFVLCHFALAQVPFPRQCPEVKLMTEFNVDKYMGIWYEYSKYPFVFEFGKMCNYAIYDNIGNNTVSVVNTAISKFTGTSSNVKGKAKIIGPGQLAVMFSNNQDMEKPNYLVLGTDYDSFAVVYSCANFTPIVHTRIVWILTRERKPKPETVDAAKKIMEDNSLSQAFLTNTIQDNCPETNTTTDASSSDNATDDTTTLSITTEFITEAEKSNLINKA